MIIGYGFNRDSRDAVHNLFMGSYFVPVLCRACNAYARVALYRNWMNMKAITEVG